MKKNETEKIITAANPQLVINELIQQLIAYDRYYAWYRYLIHTGDPNYTGFNPTEKEKLHGENPTEALEYFIKEGKTSILVYINTDDEFINFFPLSKEQLELEFETEFTTTIRGITFYITMD